ncbi:phage tail protein [Pseudomonas agarici]|uniref:Phage tail protein n=1 Tax=Pseudomonas agarici TaxID=46677 RepID=A0A0X1T3T0_PSEAA|nr:tail fiber protein [Pseudomonas agarici]AMB86735.1 phage tail protein [Pseudomonas agarici]NWB93939.1 tail fiber protein [Pseudomonas agarici]NWC11437.1 tail fiber protein [Pseudomonas agarici]SEL69807.1 Microcystin-dependent protein [Pseudomonas agarici]
MEVFLGTIQMFGFNFAPSGWALCGGQLLPLSQYQALFALMGTTYGGNGQQTFGLPNLQGRLPVCQGNGPGLTSRVMGEASGTENVSILTSNLPTQVIPTSGLTVDTTINLASTPSNPVTAPTSTNAYIGASNPAGPPSAAIYSDAQGASPVALKGAASTIAGNLTLPGGNLPLGTMNPFLVVNFSIALEGIFPSRN